MSDTNLIRLERLNHPRTVAAAWWVVTLVCLWLLGQAYWRQDWSPAIRAQAIQEFWLVAIALPGLFLLMFSQQTLISDTHLVIRQGWLGLLRTRLPLAEIREIRAVEVDSMADFSRKETGGHGRGMSCYYTKGRHGVEVIMAHRRLFISSCAPEALVAAVHQRQATPPRG